MRINQALLSFRNFAFAFEAPVCSLFKDLPSVACQSRASRAVPIKGKAGMTRKGEQTR